MDTLEQSEKEKQARGSLPDYLRPIFYDFVADYKCAATLRHDRPCISYIVLADMVRAGWRRTAESVEETKQ